MVVEALVTPLLRVPIFQGLGPLHLGKIARLAERMVYRPGDVIVRRGEDADAAILLVAGEAVRIQGPDGDDDEAVEPGTLVAEMAMLIETEHSSTVVAREQVRALRLPRAALNELMQQEPELAVCFLDKLTARLQALGAELARIDSGLGSADTAYMPITSGEAVGSVM